MLSPANITNLVLTVKSSKEVTVCAQQDLWQNIFLHNIFISKKIAVYKQCNKIQFIHVRIGKGDKKNNS